MCSFCSKCTPLHLNFGWGCVVMFITHCDSSAHWKKKFRAAQSTMRVGDPSFIRFIFKQEEEACRRTTIRTTPPLSQRQHTHTHTSTVLQQQRRSHAARPEGSPSSVRCFTAFNVRAAPNRCMHSVPFHAPSLLDTHQVLSALGVQYQAILLAYGNSPKVHSEIASPSIRQFP